MNFLIKFEACQPKGREIKNIIIQMDQKLNKTIKNYEILPSKLKNFKIVKLGGN